MAIGQLRLRRLRQLQRHVEIAVGIGVDPRQVVGGDGGARIDLAAPCCSAPSLRPSCPAARGWCRAWCCREPNWALVARTPRAPCAPGRGGLAGNTSCRAWRRPAGWSAISSQRNQPKTIHAPYTKKHAVMFVLRSCNLVDRLYWYLSFLRQRIGVLFRQPILYCHHPKLPLTSAFKFFISRMLTLQVQTLPRAEALRRIRLLSGKDLRPLADDTASPSGRTDARTKAGPDRSSNVISGCRKTRCRRPTSARGN